MALGNITLRSTSSSSVVNLKANVDATIDIVNRPLTHEEVDLNFLEIGESVNANLITNFTTSDLLEGTNLYFTDARVGTYLSGTAKLSNLSDVDTPTASDNQNVLYYDHSTTSFKWGQYNNTDDLPEGTSNLYYTDARFDTRLATKSTTNLSEGTNLYYTDARWDTRLGTKTTTNLTEGTNLYFTNARADARADVRIAASSINALSDVDTTGIASTKILQYNGTNWVVVNSTTTTLSGMTDTTISGPSNGEVLKYNGSAWVNSSDSTDWDADLKANTLTSSTGDIKVSTYADKNFTLDLTSNASIVANANTAIGDVISSAYLNTATDIDAAVNFSDIKIKSDFLSGLTLLQNTNNQNISVDTGANLSAYHFSKNGNSGFNISLFNQTHPLYDSYVTGTKNGSMWQFKTVDRSSDQNAEARVTIFSGDARGKIIHENRAYDNIRRYSVPLTDAEAYGPINAEYTAKDFTITASGDLKLKPTGKLDIGTTPGHWNATTQARIQKSWSYFETTGVDNTKRHYNEAHGNKLVFGTNVDSGNRKQGALVDTKFDLNGYTFGLDDPTNLSRMLGGTYNWTSLENTGGSAKSVSGATAIHAGAEISVGGSNLTLTHLTGLTALGYLDDSSATVTNLAAIIAHTDVDNGTATNRYSIYAPESNDKAYFAGQITTGAITLPNTDGSANQVLKTNGSGTVSWGSGTNLVDDTSPQLGGDLESNGNDIKLADNDELKVGNNPDLKISHTNSLSSQNDSEGDSILDGGDWCSLINENGTGPLVFKSNGGPSTGAYHFYDTSWRPILKLYSGVSARASLFYAGVEKLITDSTGVTVTGRVNSKSEPGFDIKTANFNTASGMRYGIDTSSNTVTATLPASPATGDAIYFADAGGNYATNKLTLNRNGKNIMGLAQDMDVTTNNQSFGVFYNGSEWRTY
jgi:hypothetical protein